MIGLALVTLVAMLATGIASTFFGAVDEIFVGDYAVTAENNFARSRSTRPRPLQRRLVSSLSATSAPARRASSARRVLDGCRSGCVQGDQARLGRGLGCRLRRARAGRRFRRQGLREEARPEDRLAGRAHDPERRRQPTFTIKGDLRPASGGSPFGVVTISTEALDAELHEPAEPVIVRPHGGRRRPTQIRRRSRQPCSRSRTPSSRRARVHRQPDLRPQVRSSTSSTSCSACPSSSASSGSSTRSC